MSSRKEIQEELEKIAPQLAQMEIRPPFSIPDGYFARLPEVVAARIRTLNAETAAEESEVLLPVLGQLPKKMPFTMPEGYFERLPHTIARQNRGTGKLVRLSRQTGLRIAVAAAAAVLIIGGVWMYSGEPAVTGPQIVARTDDSANGSDLAERPDLLRYMQFVSDAEIIQYVEPGPAPAEAASGVTENNPAMSIGEEDLSLLLADISDQELESYLAISDI